MVNRMFARRLPLASSLVAVLVAAVPLTTMALAEMSLDAVENDRIGLLIGAKALDDGMVESLSLGQRIRRQLEDGDATETLPPSIFYLDEDEEDKPDDSASIDSSIDGLGDAEQNEEASPDEVTNDEKKENVESESTEIIDQQEESKNSETGDGVGDAEQNDEVSPEKVTNDANKENVESDQQEESENPEAKEESNADGTNDVENIEPEENHGKAQNESTSLSPSIRSSSKEETKNNSKDTEIQDSPLEDHPDESPNFQDEPLLEDQDEDSSPKDQDKDSSPEDQDEEELEDQDEEELEDYDDDEPEESEELEDYDDDEPEESEELEDYDDDEPEESEDTGKDNDDNTGEAANNKEDNEENDKKDEPPTPVDPGAEKPQQQKEYEKKTKEDIKWEKDDEGNGGFLSFLFLIGLIVLCVKQREKIATLVRSAGGSGNVGGFGGISDAKYEKVSALQDPNDEEWGWGDSDDNGSNDSDNDDDDNWGDDDDWDDGMGTSNNKNIEMTTPSFSSNKPSFSSNKAHRSTNPPPVAKSLSLSGTNGGTSGMSNLGGSNGFGSSSQTARMLPGASSSSSSPMGATAISTNATPTLGATSPTSLGITGSQLPMNMGIASLGLKKKPTVAAKPKKKKLLGASDDDLFASMGFGGPPSVSKPKPKTAPLPSKFASGSSSRWAVQPTPTVKPLSVTPPKKPASSTLGIATAAAVIAPAVIAHVVSTPASAPAPALIPDGFGDDDDLNLDDDVLGGTGDAGGGGNDDWGDDDGDLDDLLDL